MPSPLFCLSDLVLLMAITSILAPVGLQPYHPPNSTGLVRLQPCESRIATKWWQLRSSTTLRVKKEILWLWSVFYARNPELFNLTEGLASLHSWQCALAASLPFLLALFPVPAAVLVYYRVSRPGWRNSSAWKNLISLLEMPRVSHWHKVLNSVTANVDAAKCASTSQRQDKALSSLLWLH